MKKLILLPLIILTSNHLFSQIDDPISIYNGESITNASTAPWVVQIRRAFLASNDYRVSCTGVLIGDRYVLTAAHCVTCMTGDDNCDYPKSAMPRTDRNYRVLFGTSTIDSEEPDYDIIEYRDIDISNIYIHGEYNGYATKDIAILEFDNPIEFTNNIQPIDFEHACPPVNDGLNIGDRVKLYGWGYDYDGDDQTPDVLQSGVLEIYQLSTDNIRAKISNDGSDTFGPPCIGDSGGPLIKEVNGKAFLVGILSTGGCLNSSQGAWERVSYYSSFIDYHINDSCKPTISTLDYVCYTNSSTTSLTNIGNAISTWTSSNNVQIVSRNNSSATIRAVNSAATGSGWVRATLNDGVELTEEFDVLGIPNVNYKYYLQNISLPNNSPTSLAQGAWGQVRVVCTSGCGDLNGGRWEYTATSSSIRNGSNNTLLILPNPGTNRVKISYRSCNDCGCSNWRYKWFDVVPNGLIPTDEGGEEGPLGWGF